MPQPVYRRLLPAIAAVLLIVSAACAPAEPTVDPAQIQASAVAAASTMVAMTQQALLAKSTWLSGQAFTFPSPESPPPWQL